MNWIRVGDNLFNLSLATQVRDFHSEEEGAVPRLEIHFCSDGTAALEGDDALALRAWFSRNSSDVGAKDEPRWATDPGGSLPFQADCGEEGT